MIIDISKGKQSQHKEIEGENIMNNTSCRNTVKISMSAALLLTVIMICCTCMTSECEAADRTCTAENEYFDGFEKHISAESGHIFLITDIITVVLR